MKHASENALVMLRGVGELNPDHRACDGKAVYGSRAAMAALALSGRDGEVIARGEPGLPLSMAVINFEQIDCPLCRVLLDVALERGDWVKVRATWLAKGAGLPISHMTENRTVTQGPQRDDPGP